ncbi:MAG TPA: nicotinamide-nucleotide amidohydrolase family protein, partial [Oligoflexia bacterium]|nr:nicotinamide-nucleotide amidohydrolase family protein [Oligoflexia bacterium]
KRRQAVLNENNLRQAHFPERALVIPNRSGSADAFLTEINKKDGKRVMVFSLPGVPLEMRVLMDEEIIPRCRALFGAQRPYHAEYLKCFGLGEAHIGGQIERCALDDAVNVAYRPRFPEILLTLTIRGRDEWPEARVRETLRQSAEKVKLALGRDYVFSSVPEESLAQVVGSLLVSNSATIACAESCSGGLLAHEFVSVPGASAFFVGSIVAYANRVKESCLGVKHETIQSFGAVSAETAAEMACAARTIMGSDFGVSVTGIAGPGGGTVDKPAGTVWCSVAHPKGVYTCRLRLSWGRDYVRRYSTFYALDLVRRFLLRLELPQAS